jgi:hypothetical protein
MSDLIVTGGEVIEFLLWIIRFSDGVIIEKL